MSETDRCTPHESSTIYVVASLHCEAFLSKLKHTQKMFPYLNLPYLIVLSLPKHLIKIHGRVWCIYSLFDIRKKRKIGKGTSNKAKRLEDQYSASDGSSNPIQSNQIKSHQSMDMNGYMTMHKRRKEKYRQTQRRSSRLIGDHIQTPPYRQTDGIYR